jgi:hypothetical protein
VDSSYRCSGLSELVVRAVRAACLTPKYPLDHFSLFYVRGCALQHLPIFVAIVLYTLVRKYLAYLCSGD